MRRWCVLILTLFMVPAASFAAAAPASLHPVDLRCEYRVNPLGIDAAAPRLSWKLEARDPAARGLAQSAYQVLAARSEALLARQQGDLWDSGKVNSGASIHVAYAGKALTSGEPVWWKVRVWDASANASAWSAPAQWTMGLLAASDWQGKWIGFDGGEGKPAELGSAQWIGAPGSAAGTVYFRHTFQIPADNPLADATLLVVGSGPTTISVNGGRPRKLQGPQDANATAITGALHPGANVVAASVEPGENAPTALIGVVELNLASGERVVVRTGDDWRATTTAPPDWEKRETSDAAWQTAKVLGPYGMAPWGDVGAGWRTVLPARLLRKDFSVSAPVKRATLYLSGLGLSEAYLNGAKVSADVLSPALSEYPKRVYYVTYDVTQRLHAGANALGVMLGNGRYFPPQRSVPTRTRYFGYPKLKLQLELELANGKTERVVSDETWKLTTDGPIRANNEYDGEVYDARQELPGWSRAGYADAKWQHAQAVEGPAGVLSAQSIEPIRVTATLKPVAVKEVRPGIYIFDMGQNMVGWCRLTVAGPRGTQVTLRHAERLRANGMLYTDNLRSAEAMDTYILKGGGTEVYEPRFTYHGFRYVEVKGFPGKPTLGALEGREVHDNLARASAFATSNPLLNQIYQAVVWGTQDNYRSVPTDCPQRDERQGWLGDRSEESLGETYLYDVAAFYSNWVRDINDSEDENGRVPDVAPSYWPLYNDDVTWPATFILAADHLYRQYGDRRVIEQNYDGMRKWILHMESYLKDGLMPRDQYGDWCPPPESLELIHARDPLRRTDGTLIGTAYFYHLLGVMARDANLVGKPADAQEYSDLAARMRAAFNQAYFHADTKLYGNGSQTASVLPLAFDMAPAGERQAVLDALVRNIEERSHGHQATGLLGGQWLMRVLSDNGHTATAYTIASQREYPGWGYMVTHGATTIWELWNGDTADPGMNSGNHVMLVGDLITWCNEYLAGIRPDDAPPAFKHIVMRPTPVGDLHYVQASYQSAYGKIASDWKIAGGRFAWSVTVPANTTATVFVPAQDAAAVTESGQPASAARGVKFLRSEAGAAVYEVGSGSYRFESALPR
jgi:alpha-L-rhamnosidase